MARREAAGRDAARRDRSEAVAAAPGAVAGAALRAVAGPYLRRVHVVPVWGRGRRHRVTRLPRPLAEVGRLPLPGLPAYRKRVLGAGSAVPGWGTGMGDTGGDGPVPHALAALVGALAAAPDVAELALFRGGGRSVLAARDAAGRWYEVWRWV